MLRTPRFSCQPDYLSVYLPTRLHGYIIEVHHALAAARRLNTEPLECGKYSPSPFGRRWRAAPDEGTQIAPHSAARLNDRLGAPRRPRPVGGRSCQGRGADSLRTTNLLPVGEGDVERSMGPTQARGASRPGQGGRSRSARPPGNSGAYRPDTPSRPEDTHAGEAARLLPAERPRGSWWFWGTVDP